MSASDVSEKDRVHQLTQVTPDGLTLTVEVIVAQTVFVVQAVVIVLVVTVLIGVGAVIVIVSIAWPEYTVLGGGVTVDVIVEYTTSVSVVACAVMVV